MKRSLTTLIIPVALILGGCGTQTDMSHSLKSEPTSASARLPSIDTAAAQRLLSPDETLQSLTFTESASQVVSGRIVGRQSPSYAVPVRAGQQLDVTMDTPSDSAWFNIQDVRDQSGAAVFAGEATAAHYGSVPAVSDTTYVIRPYLNRGVARRGESADYTLKIERH